MKKTLGCLTGGLSLLALPFSFYGGWLLYNHVHATELMWFIWWITIPLILFVNVLEKVVDKLIKEDK